jgi:DNA-binding XRE family transcriptional regulator
LNARRISRKPKGYPENPTTLAGHLLKRRKELGLLQREVAQRLDIGHETYITWEKYGRMPVIMHWPAIINFLGYDPSPPAKTFSDRIEEYRRRTGSTFFDLGRKVGLDPSTIQSWARGTHPPNRKGHILEKFLETSA